MQHTDCFTVTVRLFIAWYLVALAYGALAYGVAGSHVATSLIIYIAEIGIIYTIGRLLMLFVVKQPPIES